MVLELPCGFIWKDEGRLAWCSSCRSVVPCSNEKQLKQHLKSKTHKKPSSLSHQQPEQLIALLEAQHISSTASSHVIQPEQYHQQHLDALHIAGTFPDTSQFAGFYSYSSKSCQRDLITQPDDCTSSSCNHDDDIPSTESPQRPAADNQQQQQQKQQGDQLLRPCWPLPFALKPKAALAAGQPFLTLVCGSIPKVPNSLDDVLQYYCHPGACRLPNIDISGVNQQVKSWSHAAKLLRAAAAAAGTHQDISQHMSSTGSNAAADPHTTSSNSKSDRHGAASNCAIDGTQQQQQQQQCHAPVVYWASLVADDISHPNWWPKNGHVPTYDNSSGPSGIGLHRDVDHSVCHNPPPVATYLTIVKGRKHVIVLPPNQTLCDVKSDKAPFPLNPSSALLQSIKSCGGGYFDLQPCADGSPVTLFIPEGWLHWLIGAAEWHVVFGGSIRTRTAA